MRRPRPRSRGRVDVNQARIVKALRSCGCLVLPLSALGGSVADLRGRRRGRPNLREIPRPGQEPTDLQLAWLQVWGGQVAHDETEALRLVGALSD